MHVLINLAAEEKPEFSTHLGDAATDTFDRDLTLSLVSFDQEKLYEIEAALRRIDDGRYGVCELTGQRIPRKRLAAIPWTRFSLAASMASSRSIVSLTVSGLGKVKGNTSFSWSELFSELAKESNSKMSWDFLSSKAPIRGRVDIKGRPLALYPSHHLLEIDSRSMAIRSSQAR